MDYKKFKRLIYLAENKFILPKYIKVEDHIVKKQIYIADDMLMPIIIYLAILYSHNIYGKSIINISLKASKDSLLKMSIDRYNDNNNDSNYVESLQVELFILAMTHIFGFKKNNTHDLTSLVTKLRFTLNQDEDENLFSVTSKHCQYISDITHYRKKTKVFLWKKKKN